MHISSRSAGHQTAGVLDSKKKTAVCRLHLAIFLGNKDIFSNQTRLVSKCDANQFAGHIICNLNLYEGLVPNLKSSRLISNSDYHR